MRHSTSRQSISGFFLAGVLLLGLAATCHSQVDESTGHEAAADGEIRGLAELAAGTGRLPGVDFAEGIGQITGVAISPLLGVCTVGTWQYFQTPADARHLLPWYCHPWIWGIGFSVLLLCFFKDSIGVAAPPLIKKPFDFAELFENKASALVASAAFVPFVAAQMSAHLQSEAAATAAAAEAGRLSLSGDGQMLAAVPLFAALPFDPLWILIPLCVAGFLVVWLISHALTVLILLSPFGFLDAILKAVRTGILGLVVLTTVLSPPLGAVLSLAIIAVAALLAPSTFRLAFFGSVIGGDYLLSLFRKDEKCRLPIYAFLARRGNQTLAARSFGTVEGHEDGRLRFRSRWIFFGHERVLALAKSENMRVDRGLLFPSLSLPASESDDGNITVVHLLPRHRHVVEQVADSLGIEDLRDNQVVRGFTAMRRWLADAIRSGRDRLLESQDGATATAPAEQG